MAARGARLVLPATARALWRWYAVLLLANALDLLFTYTAAERGIDELNPLLRPLLLTPWPTIIKAGVLLLLAVGLWTGTRRAGARPPVLSILRGAAFVYVVLIVFHLVGLLRHAG
jgi:hypothetical protein